MTVPGMLNSLCLRGGAMLVDYLTFSSAAPFTISKANTSSATRGMIS